MYRQVLIDPKDTPYQRIFWRDEVNDEIQEFELLTITYGTSCAPYLTIKVLHQLAEDERENFQIGSEILKSNFYVDDFICCSSTIEEAINQKQSLQNLLLKEGFHLRKWSSNNQEFLATIPMADQEQAISLDIQVDSSIKTLGLQWLPNSDEFTFQVKINDNKVYTKRLILSEVSKLYDPLGPVIVYAKILLQQIWVIGADWDDALPEAISNKYTLFSDNLKSLSNLRIPRWISIENDSTIYLCGFCDASESAYAAAVYVRINNKEEVKVRLLASKTKVAPIQQISLPRLELCGALLLAKFISKIKDKLKLENVAIIAFTDSTIVLAWLHELPRKWKSFIANRTSQILSQVPYQKWRHVRSSENPADVATRGILGNELLQSKI